MNTPKRNTSYEKQLEQALRELRDRTFSYNPAEDPLAREARRTAVTEGRAAAKDTAARLSARTGGYANSYAATAATGAYLASLQTLQERLPDLVKLAKSVYDSRTKELTDRVSALQKASEQAYRNWRAEVQDAQTKAAAETPAASAAEEKTSADGERLLRALLQGKTEEARKVLKLLLSKGISQKLSAVYREGVQKLKKQQSGRAD